MSYAAVLDALGDPTRRAILERLRQGPAAVGEIAARLPVSRPAVSKHLAVLAQAGVVSHTRQANRSIYRVQPEGLADVRAYFESFWDGALNSFAAAAAAQLQESDMSTPAPPIAPIVKSLAVKLPVEQAFSLFTYRIASWWPMATHSVGGAGSTLAFTDGQLIETNADGTSRSWGTVLEWEPPARVQFTWHPGSSPESATLVTVTFAATEPGVTAVELTHDGWAAADADARSDYDGGWDGVLAKFEASA